VEVPPYGGKSIDQISNTRMGKLNAGKQWFATTPLTVLAQDKIVRQFWSVEIPCLIELSSVRQVQNDVQLIFVSERERR